MTQEAYTPTERDTAHGKSALFLLGAIALIILLSVFTAFRVNDVTGTYRFAYRIDEEGVKTTEGDSAFVIKDGGTVIHLPSNAKGKWTKSLNEITVDFGGGNKTTFHRSGDTITDYSGEGKSRVVYRRD